MPVKSVLVNLYLPTSHSLKEKRSIVKSIIKSIIKKLRNRYNASVAEISGLDKWQYAGIGISVISIDRIIIEKIHSNIINFIENNYTDIQIMGIQDYE
ncbi:MAG: DUF503 domain-containing protein [Candidatus Celaenobacter polaris]|nr:DUF503 domain-containing protein [Candidatus Celaenobacter polaris]